MKKDRFWLYWGIYAGILLAVNVLLAFFFPQNASFHIVMICPAIILVALIYQGWYTRIHNITNVVVDTFDLHNRKPLWDDFLIGPPLLYEKIFSTVCLYLAPWTLPFFFFVPHFYKFFALLLIFPPFIVFYGVAIVYNWKSSKEHIKTNEKTRKEQEKREELGKWK